jgi:hypothetical protein
LFRTFLFLLCLLVINAGNVQPVEYHRVGQLVDSSGGTFDLLARDLQPARVNDGSTATGFDDQHDAGIASALPEHSGGPADDVSVDLQQARFHHPNFGKGIRAPPAIL